MTRILYDRAGPGPKVTEAYKSDIVNKNNVYDSRPDNVAKDDHLAPGDGERKNEKEIEPPRYDPELRGLRSFFSRSWIEFPDSSSNSRVMKARCAVGCGLSPSGIYSVASDRRRKNGRRPVRGRSLGL